MVSLYITAMAKAIRSASTADHVYCRLRRRWYLSRRARAEPNRVIDLIRRTQGAYLERHQFGEALSGVIVSALSAAGFLSKWGRTWGMRPRSRRSWGLP